MKTLHSRRFLLIYLVVIIVLLLLLRQQYATDDTTSAVLPASQRYDPPVTLPQLLMKTDNGVRSNIHFQQQWTYLVFIDPDCEQYCDAPLHVLQALPAALGKSAPAIFAIATDQTHCPTDAAGGVVCGVVDDNQQNALLKTAGIAMQSHDDKRYSNFILLVNPDAKLQYRYRLPLDSGHLITDFINQRQIYARDPRSGQRR